MFLFMILTSKEFHLWVPPCHQVVTGMSQLLLLSSLSYLWKASSKILGWDVHRKSKKIIIEILPHNPAMKARPLF